MVESYGDAGRPALRIVEEELGRALQWVAVTDELARMVIPDKPVTHVPEAAGTAIAGRRQEDLVKEDTQK